MKNLSPKEIKERVKKGQYTDLEWNTYDLWKYVNYKSKAVNLYYNKNKNFTDAEKQI